MHPLISVALCTFNGEAYLEEQLDSVLAQDWPHLEVVVVDDGSTDGTREILRSYGARDARIRLYFNEVNLGFLANFERAFSLTQGEFIAPCDQDDWWDPRKLTALHQAIQGRGLAFCDSEFMNPKGESLGIRVSDVVNMYDGDDPTPFVFANCASGHAMLVRRTLVERAMPFPRGHFHDWWLAFLASAAEGLVYLPEALVHYRQHPSAQTNLAGHAPKANTRRSRLQEIQRRQDWLDLLATVPGVHQTFLKRLSESHAAWQDSWLCPRMAQLLFRKRKTLFLINRRASRQRLRRVLKYLPGLKLKRLVTPSRYRETSQARSDLRES